MVIIKKIFNGGLNSDSSAKTLAAGQVLNLQGARWGVSEDGRNNRLESCRGTSLISQTVLPSGTHLTLGSAVDDARKRILYLNWNSAGEHGIYCYDELSGITYRVLTNSQVTGGLNFSKSSRIDRNARVVGDMLYFTDGTENGQRKVNIEAGIKLNHGSYTTTVAPYIYPVNFSEITLIKPPPALAPTIQKDFDSSFVNNFIANESFSYAFQYVYRDNEKSVVGAYSRASRLNKEGDTVNRVIVKMGAAEIIPQTVSIIRLIVRIGNSAFVAKTWDSSITSEATEISNQNNGTFPLTYNFYNNNTGEYLSQGDILKPYDSVPRSSKTIEFAKDRIFLGNNKDGYDAPTTTSLTFTLSSSPISGTALVKNLIQVHFSYIGDTTIRYDAWFVSLSNTDNVFPAGYYELSSTHVLDGTIPAAPTTIAFSDLAFRGVTQEDVWASVRSAYTITGIRTTTFFTFTSNVCTITGKTVSTFDVFKSKAQYSPGVVFYDFAMRKCGVVKSNTPISIPARNYASSTGVDGILVSLSNTNALQEIPDWAYYYSFVRTLNLRTRFFIQSFDNGLKYATKNTAGEYKYDETTFVTGAVAVAIDTTAVVQSGLGYSFTEGDVCYLIKSDNTTYELPVIGQNGKYILLKAKDIGVLLNTAFVYEVFTPYKTSEQEPYFEIGDIYKVNNPTTNTRAYSTLTDILLPDSYVLTRNYLATTYFAEAMCPKDAYYKRWDNDGGKVNLITKLGARSKTQSIYWSNTFLAGTAVNGLSTFEPLNQKSLPLEMGELNKLQSANKIEEQGQGSVMLAICAASQTASLYLSEIQLSASAKSSDIVRSDEVIGSINVLSGSWGTTHPETVIEYGGLVYWIDTIKRTVVQYSGNGLDSISKFNMARFFEKYFKAYDSTAFSAIDTLNGFHHIPTAIDPSFRKELLVVTPALAAESTMTDLPSYSGTPSFATSIKNRFDVADNQGKAIGYSIEGNIWQHTYPFAGEHYEYVGNNVYGFKNGLLYSHDSNNVNWNTFYGVASPIRLCFPVNEIVGGETELLNIAIEGNAAPTYSVAYSDNPDVQITDLVLADFKKQGTPFFAKFFRDRLSPNVTGSADEKLFKGDEITGYPLMIMLEWNVNDRLIYIDAVDIGLEVSRGLKQIIQK